MRINLAKSLAKQKKMSKIKINWREIIFNKKKLLNPISWNFLRKFKFLATVSQDPFDSNRFFNS